MFNNNNNDVKKETNFALVENKTNSLCGSFFDVPRGNSVGSSSACSSPLTPTIHIHSCNYQPNGMLPSHICPISSQCGDFASLTLDRHQHTSHINESINFSMIAYQHNQMQQLKQQQLQLLRQQQQQQQQMLQWNVLQQREQNSNVNGQQLQLNYSRDNGGNAPPKDEICKSLKMFAMAAAYNDALDRFSTSITHVPNNMNDFANNGYCTEDKYNTMSPTSADFVNYMMANTNNQNAAIKSEMYQPGLVAGQKKLHALQSSMWKTPRDQSTFNNNPSSGNIASHGASVGMDRLQRNYPHLPVKRFPKRYPPNPKHSPQKHCVFCENNNEPIAVVKSHSVRDMFGRVLCPKLRTYVCPICKASGDSAHTIKYCPQKPIITMDDAIRAESIRLARDSYYKQQMKV